MAAICLGLNVFSKVNIGNFPFSTHERVFLWKCQGFRDRNVSTWGGLEPPTFRLMPKALAIWAMKARHLLSHVSNTGFGGMDIFVWLITNWLLRTPRSPQHQPNTSNSLYALAIRDTILTPDVFHLTILPCRHINHGLYTTPQSSFYAAFVHTKISSLDQLECFFDSHLLIVYTPSWLLNVGPKGGCDTLAAMSSGK